MPLRSPLLEFDGGFRYKGAMSARPEWKRRWEPLRARILERDSFLCRPCHEKGRYTEATSVDHIVPRSKGGTNCESNLQAICGDCHDAKSKREANAGYREPLAVGVDGGPAGW